LRGRRAAGFDLEIRHPNRQPITDNPSVYMESLLELARWSDFLVVASAGATKVAG
jgi:hydroxypyruvate reductase